MLGYILKRIALIFVTLFVILTINFFIIQLSPGGPVDTAMNKIKSTLQNSDAESSSKMAKAYQAAAGLEPEQITELTKLYGFDKPILERYWHTITNYLRFQFGRSYFKNQDVIDLIKDRLPISISLGLWSTILIYMFSIPLGIRKAMLDGTKFDIWTTLILMMAYSLPTIVLAILLLVSFGPNGFFPVFPLMGLTSYETDGMTYFDHVLDYFHHIALPTITIAFSGLAYMTFLTKNSFCNELGKQYIITAHAKGLNEKQILYRHAFRNAMLLVIASIPSALISVLFAGSILVESIFNLDGLGQMGFQAAMTRDYPVIFATLYIFTLIGLVSNLVTDVMYVLIDPRIDFEK